MRRAMLQDIPILTGGQFIEWESSEPTVSDLALTLEGGLMAGLLPTDPGFSFSQSLAAPSLPGPVSTEVLTEISLAFSDDYDTVA